MEPNPTIGIIAGGGQFPKLFSRAARQKGYKVVALALTGHADADLAEEMDVCLPVGLLQVGKMISLFRDQGVSQAVMLGKIYKPKVFSQAWRTDLKTMSLLAQRRHGHDDHLLRLFAEAMAQSGITIQPSTMLLPDLLVPAGQLGRRKPSKRQAEDAAWGFELAKQLGQYDIGQCLVVRMKTVLAVEAIEGTDAAIERGGAMGGGKAVVIKVAKPQQDLRFDLPSIGADTIRTMARAGCTCLAVEADRTLCFDQREVIALADQNKIAVLAMVGEQS